MRSTALKKSKLAARQNNVIEFPTPVREMTDEEAFARIWDAWCLKITAISEAAAHLPGNELSCDFDQFEEQYGLCSDFA